jgi:hypothetical protein
LNKTCRTHRGNEGVQPERSLVSGKLCKIYIKDKKKLDKGIRDRLKRGFSSKSQAIMKNILAINNLISLIIILVVDVLICCEARG